MLSTTHRRDFLKQLVAGGLAVAGAHRSIGAEDKPAPLHLGCNQYAWFTFYRRDGKEFGKDLRGVLAEVKAAGLSGYESSADSSTDFDALSAAMKEHGLEMRSLYVNSELHEPDRVDESIQRILVTAKTAHDKLKTRIIVTNPNPLRWGGTENKNDHQLQTQAAAMNRLGEGLEALGLQLAYHNHDIELRMAAPEFHHMMVATDPKFVGLCLDAHWVYRGAGNSSVALFDVVKLYGPRTIELHLRQSRDAVWTETFEDGDIDYRRLAATLADQGVKPHLVLEQCIEQGSPQQLDVVEAHRRSCRYARELFAAWAA